MGARLTVARFVGERRRSPCAFEREQLRARATSAALTHAVIPGGRAGLGLWESTIFPQPTESRLTERAVASGNRPGPCCVPSRRFVLALPATTLPVSFPAIPVLDVETVLARLPAEARARVSWAKKPIENGLARPHSEPLTDELLARVRFWRSRSHADAGRRGQIAAIASAIRWIKKRRLRAERFRDDPSRAVCQRRRHARTRLVRISGEG
jgi:hypothetical protein